MVVNQLIIKLKDTIVMEITKDKITEIFCIIDEFCQEYDKEIARMSICESDGRKHRNRKYARKVCIRIRKSLCSFVSFGKNSSAQCSKL